VIASFSGLFEHLNAGGIYVIEDLHVAGMRDWGSTSFNRGMDLEHEQTGNDPDQMVSFLTSIRARKDVAELTVHLKKICFIHKASGHRDQDHSEPERGDRLGELFPPVLRKTLLQKIAGRLVGGI
jgi:hypothetical protein